MLKFFIKKYKIQNSIILFSYFVIALIQTLSAVMHTFATDALIRGDFKNFILWNLFSLLIWGLLFIINYFNSIYEEKIIQLISTDIRSFIMTKIIHSSYKNVSSNSDGMYTSWLNNDLKQIQDIGLRQYYEFWGNIFSVVLSVIALISYHYSLVLITFILMGILLKFPSLFEKKMETATEKLASENENFVSKIQDTFSGYDMFFSFNNLLKMKSRILHISKNISKENISYIKTMKFSEGFIGIINIFSQIGIVTATGILAYLKIVTIGSLSSTGSLASTIFNSVSAGSQNLMRIKTTDSFFKKYEKFNASIDDKVIHNKYTRNSINQSIELHDISYNIDGKQIINHANYTFEIGKKYAIIGKTGSGKSTLLNILAGKIIDFTGEILLDGNPIKSINDLKTNIAYIPQTSYIFNDTIENNIGLWRDINNNRINEAYKKLDIHHFANLNSKIEENGKNLSGGQKQRIAFARVLIGTQSIYLLDESTTNLDKFTAIQLENMLLDDPNATVIMVTHHLFDENKNKFDEIIYIH